MTTTFIKSIFSEPDGNGSSSRVLIAIIVAFILGVGVSFATLVHGHKLTPDQFNSFLQQGSNFILTTCGPLYGINKITDVIKNKSGNDQGQ